MKGSAIREIRGLRRGQRGGRVVAVSAEAAGGCGTGTWLRGAGLALWARIAWAAVSRAAPAVAQVGGCVLEMQKEKAKNLGCRGHNRDTKYSTK